MMLEIRYTESIVIILMIQISNTTVVSANGYSHAWPITEPMFITAHHT